MVGLITQASVVAGGSDEDNVDVMSWKLESIIHWDNTHVYLTSATGCSVFHAKCNAIYRLHGIYLALFNIAFYKYLNMIAK